MLNELVQYTELRGKKNKMKYLLVLCLMVMMRPAWAQEKTDLVFDKVTHYFGTFPVSKGKLSCTFSFTNQSDQVVLIKRVRSGCGCTAAEYTRAPVEPGEKGTIRVTFDPSGRSGYFSKKVMVYVSGQDKPIYLSVTGRIRVNSRVADQFKEVFGPLRANGSMINIGECARKEGTCVGRIRYINMKTQACRIELEAYPDWLKTCSLSDNDLLQGEYTELTTTVEPMKMDVWGERRANVMIKITNDKVKKMKEVPIRVVVVDDFSQLSEADVRNAPLMSVERDSMLIFTNEEKPVKVKIELSNEGKETMLIRNVQSFDQGVRVLRYDEEIKPAKIGSVLLECQADMPEVSKLKIFSNSPQNYIQEIDLYKYKEE